MHKLSGGEKTICSLCFIFALHYYKPNPIYFLDEVDAALDYKNDKIISRFVKEHSKNAQFISISLRVKTLEIANRIFGMLHKEQANEFISIWEEFETGQTNEAKFAKSMDRFEPLLQNTSNNGGTWAEFNVPYQKVYDKKKAIKDGSTSIWNYAERLINESVDKGILKKETN